MVLLAQRAGVHHCNADCTVMPRKFRARRTTLGPALVLLGSNAMEHNDFEVLLRSRIPLIAVESRDETEVLKALTRACTRFPASGASANPSRTLEASTGLPLFQWTVTDGLEAPGHRCRRASAHHCRAGRGSEAHPCDQSGGVLRAARFSSVPARAHRGAPAQGHRPGLRALRAHHRAHQLRARGPTRDRAPDRALLAGAPRSQRAAPARRGGRAAMDAQQPAAVHPWIDKHSRCWSRI